ncbi:hypothetical protein [Alkalihalobacillus sp. R86527]|uniref:phosphotransferase-like protein n=1 Tax=Alkalihalobacillus sp. R86527 TaxID=3093863 RepID=UPI00366B6FD4
MNGVRPISKLIILRGNSASGKSTIAKALQNHYGDGTLLVSQRYRAARYAEGT